MARTRKQLLCAGVAADGAEGARGACASLAAVSDSPSAPKAGRLEATARTSSHAATRNGCACLREKAGSPTLGMDASSTVALTCST